jgi:hypothetical protein
MTKPDITAVATLAGRKLDVMLWVYLFDQPKPRWVKRDFGANTPAEPMNDAGDVVPCYSRDRDPSLFDLSERVRADGWTSIVIHVSYISGVAYWNATICCGRGPCELHGNPHDNYHAVEAEGSTLNEALARAALLTYPPKEAPDAR